MELSKKDIDGLRRPAAGQALYWFTSPAGMGVRITPTARSFIFEKRVDGRKRRVTICKIPDVIKADILKHAYERATELANEFARGIDPVVAKARREASATTLRDAFKRYAEAPKKKGTGKGSAKKPRTIRDIEETSKRFNDWMDKAATEITGTMVKERHAKIAATSPAQADLACRYLRAALNHVNADSDDEEPIIRVNPVDRLNRTNQWSETKRKTRHISEDRIYDWVQAVRTGLIGLDLEDEKRDILLFLLLTGARISEVIGSRKDGYPPLTWRNVDFERRTVTFSQTKNRADHVLPIGNKLVEMLTARKRTAGPIAVFSDVEGNIPNYLSSAYERIENLMGVYVSAHDLRRTFATVASKLDISSYKLKRLTNHISGNDVTAGYVQITTEDLRDAMQRIENHMLRPQAE